jgi:hypothetical protein
MSKHIIKGNRFVALVVSVVLLGNALWGGAALGQKAESMVNITNEQVIAALSSQDAEVAHQAVEEIMKRGERMLTLLMGCRGNTNFFYGYGLGHHSSSFLIPLPKGNSEVNDGSLVTVEVAALYLISAIYHKTLEFADAPYLTDGRTVKWQRFNTPKRVNMAWHAVETWMNGLKSEGLDSLRTKQRSPLAACKVHFWGGR